MQEIWRDVEGFVGIYQVSNLGNVRRIAFKKTRKTRLLKKNVNKCGYEYVNLRYFEKRKSMLVHRLVAMAFIPNPNCSQEVNHIDENKRNNIVSNLEWCDHLHNMRHSYNLHSDWRTRGKIKYDRQVLKKDKNNNVIEIYENVVDAGNKNKIRKDLIRKCCKGELKTTNGYVWEFAD